MLRNYLKIAWRNLRKNKLYAGVNILGLSVGIASCILLGLYIIHELSYDRFHLQADRIVRVTMEYSNGGTVGKYANTGTKVGPQFKRTFPSVKAFVRLFQYGRLVSSGDRAFDEKNFFYADSSFFQIFSFPLLRGNPETVLNAPGQIVLTQHMAKKYFGNGDPIGKRLKISNSDIYTVTGIAQDPPDNSQIRFDLVASFTSLDVSRTEDWWTANDITYLLMQDPDQIGPLRAQIRDYMKSPQVRQQARTTGNDYLTYHLEPIKKVHLYSNLVGFGPNGSITYIYVLGAIALLILIIACVNYTNLATAQSAARSGEISIRKVLGAHRTQIFAQYLGESALLTGGALILAILLCVELLPLFNRLSDKSLSVSVLFRPISLMAILGLGMAVTLLSGAYPAMVLSGAKLISMLKSGFSFSTSGRGMRKSLIVFQFLISVFLLITTIIILQQISYIRDKKLGYDKDHVLVLPVDYQMHAHYDAIKAAIRLGPNVLNVGGAYESPTLIQWGDGIEVDNGSRQKNLSVTALPSDLDLVKTLNMQILEGSDFSISDLKMMDTSDNYRNYKYTFLINESALKAIGWKPREAIGKTIFKGSPGIVKGVVKDFNFSSLHEAISPLILFLDTQYIHQMFVRISGKDIPGTLNYLQNLWKQWVPYRPFEYHFLDEDYNALYKVETRTGQLFTVFSAIAILLACMGLFALAAYTTIQRTKEIGIRKVLGASPINITGLISMDFLKLVLIASLLAIPISWWAVHVWLDNFAYRIEIRAWVFIGASLMALLIAFLTVSFQAIKAAIANPVKSLRTE
jgi:putative ABC transport system permease protein